MKKLILYTVVIALSALTSCKDYLDRPTLNEYDDTNFWRNENTVRMYAQGAYIPYFQGYGSGDIMGNWFSGQSTTDELISTSQWETNTATSSTTWTFSWVRRHNLMLNRIENSPTLSSEQKQHWTGIARFFRALEYSDLCSTFGDMPYYDRELSPNETDVLYKNRDPLSFCVTKIIEDFDYAVANVREDDGLTQINRNIVLANMTRRLLYFGTMLKYHTRFNAAATSTAALEKAKWAAEQLIGSNKYQIVDDYRRTFTTPNTLVSNPEVIFYREYAAVIATHCMITYNVLEAQTGTTLKVINNYLATDGLPIKQSPLYDYSLDKYYSDMVVNRDPRLLASFDEDIRPQGPPQKNTWGYSTTGIASIKLLPYDALPPVPTHYTLKNNVVACPIIRYGEILVAYAEIMAELGQFTQAVADASINKLRARKIKKNGVDDDLPQLPPMVVSGSNITANGVVIDDPDRDPSVSPILWEIRRERWAELIFEGQRRGDLKRWKKFSYLKTVQTSEDNPTDISWGAPFDFYYWGNPTSTDPDEITNLKAIRNAFREIGRLFVFTEGDSTRLAIYPLYQAASRRDWVDGNDTYERQYFNAVPLDQISMYKERGYTLTQNPGWLQEAQ